MASTFGSNVELVWNLFSGHVLVHREKGTDMWDWKALITGTLMISLAVVLNVLWWFFHRYFHRVDSGNKMPHYDTYLDKYS